MQRLLLLMLILPGMASAVEKLPYSVLNSLGETELRLSCTQSGCNAGKRRI